MSTIVKRNRSTQGSTVSSSPKRLQLKNRKYGVQVTKLRAGQKVTARTAAERRGIYDTLRSLNINSNFRSTKTPAGNYVISKRYSSK